MAKRRSRRKKRLMMGLAVLLVIATAVGVLAIAWTAMDAGYDTYIKSTYTLEYYDTVIAACEQYDVSPSLVYAVIRTESKFDPNAVSSADARGLMQLTAVALEWIRLRSDEFDDVTLDQLFDPATNIRCGVYFISLLQEQFSDEQTVVAAYNAGLGKVRDWLGDSTYSDDGKTLHTIPYAETRSYVKRVASSKAIYQEYYQLDHPKGEP